MSPVSEWALADLAMNAELCGAFGGSSSLVANWHARHNGFPRALRVFRMGRLFSYQHVCDWWRHTLTSHRRTDLLRDGAPAPETLPLPYPGVAAGGLPNWELHDLAGYAELCDVLAVPKGRLTMWAHRRDETGFPRPLLNFAMGPVYSTGEVQQWLTRHRALAA